MDWYLVILSSSGEVFRSAGNRPGDESIVV